LDACFTPSTPTLPFAPPYPFNLVEKIYKITSAQLHLEWDSLIKVKATTPIYLNI